MAFTVNIRSAEPGDADEISKVAIRSKAHWGYSQEFMDACVDELSVSPDQIREPSNYYMVAETANEIIGFYAIECISHVEYELEALFVDSDHIGTGVGKMLMNHAKQEVRKLGGNALILQSDPNASAFYRSAGGKFIGERESGSIPGRFLPVFRIELDSDSAP